MLSCRSYVPLGVVVAPSSADLDHRVQLVALAVATVRSGKPSDDTVRSLPACLSHSHGWRRPCLPAVRGGAYEAYAASAGYVRQDSVTGIPTRPYIVSMPTMPNARTRISIPVTCCG